MAIRDPSDGSVRRQEPAPPVLDGAQAALAPGITGFIPVIDTSTSGLPPTTAKADYLARLEESREWLENYVRPTIIG